MKRNGDGKHELIANKANNSLSYMQNNSVNGLVNFLPAVEIAGLGYISSEWMRTADFDGDGKPDLLTEHGNKLVIFQNNSVNGIFSLKKSLDLMFDFDVDRNFVVGDFDNDGKPDIAAINYYGTWQISIYRNTSNGGIISFANPFILNDTNPQEDTFWNIETGDLDSDGKLDIIVTNGRSTVTIFRNITENGNISFAPRIDIFNNNENLGLAIGDLNGDGKPELLVSTTQRYYSDTSKDVQVDIFENKSSPGSILFGPPIDLGFTNLNHGTREICIADFNGDGKPEIAALNTWTHNFSIIHENENSSLPIVLVDFFVYKENNDGKLEWKTSSEFNSNYYRIQRSIDGFNFYNIDSVKAVGNDNSSHHYVYLDSNIFKFKQGVIYYRLMEVDNDGKTQYSKIVNLRIVQSEYEIDAFPNPVNHILNLKLPNTLTSNSLIFLSDLTGKKIWQKNYFSGLGIIQIDMHRFNTGYYTLSVLENGKIVGKKLVFLTK